jgi:hypothetical protein
MDGPERSAAVGVTLGGFTKARTRQAHAQLLRKRLQIYLRRASQPGVDEHDRWGAGRGVYYRLGACTGTRRVTGWVTDRPALVLATAYPEHPERFVRKPLARRNCRPPRSNPPDGTEAAAQ